MDATPGQVPAALTDAGVGLLRGDERGLEAMSDGRMASVAPTT